ncbi:MAG: hypothetical protein ABIO85_04305 [Sphingomicrobium sp.]
MMLPFLVAAAGWIGAVVILVSYFLLTAGKLSAKDAAYQWMNVIGAAGFIVNSAWNGAWPSAILNIIWVGIGLVALIRMMLRRAPATPE